MHEIIETYLTTCKLDGAKVKPSIKTPWEKQYYTIEFDFFSKLIAFGSIDLYEDKFEFYASDSNLSIVKDLCNAINIEFYVRTLNPLAYSLIFENNDPVELIKSLVEVEDAIRNY